MNSIGKLAVIAAIVLSSATGVAAPSAAIASPPWYADTTYYTGGVSTGSSRYYCDGRVRDLGDVINYDESVYVVYYDCP